MRAVTVHDKKVTVEDHPDPVARAGEVLIRVRAAGMNGADMMQMAGHYPPPPGWPDDIPGLELAGEVIGLGEAVTRFVPGDRVMGIVGGGGQAELAVVHERTLMPIPEELSFNEAGAVPEVFTTAHDAIFTQAGLRPGERLLVHGAAGGVGTAAVQLGKMAGAHVIASVRNPDAREKVAALGANVVAPEDFVDAGPYDVILELVGSINLENNLKSLNIGGRITVIGTSAGHAGELNLGLLMAKRARIHGSTLRARPLEDKAMTARAMERSVLPGFATGALTVPIAEEFALEDATAAYERFAAGNKFGNYVLVMQ